MKHLLLAIFFFCLSTTAANAQGTKQCFGDGVDNICPCLNNNNSSGIRGNEAGCANGSTLSGCHLDAGGGTDSVSADDLVLCFEDSVPNVPGILFCGTTSVAIPFGDGIRCAGGNIGRIETIFSNAAGAGCTTVGIASTAGHVAGDVGVYQYWYRDPAGPCGGGFNFSNAYEVVWTP